ncbi:MAG: nicotinamide mononucleotide transporter [Tidjanibacter sp.]|nr:nicotinamide mononucleotide transporter [Tidjanibacter sp.]
MGGKRMGLRSCFATLTPFERRLWIISLVVVTLSFLLSPEVDYLNLLASLIGVTGLIFLAKGMVLGQIITIIFSVLYAIISYSYAYYGEVLTYAAMTLPMAVVSLVQWLRHPFEDSGEVEIAKVRGSQVAVMFLLAIAVTVIFYFVLGALGTANLYLSTFSVTTSFVAVYLTALRSPLYALGYSLNDVVLIGLWIMATIDNPAYAPMVACFVMFLANDIYGYVNWQHMHRRQRSGR